MINYPIIALYAVSPLNEDEGKIYVPMITKNDWNIVQFKDTICRYCKYYPEEGQGNFCHKNPVTYEFEFESTYGCNDFEKTNIAEKIQKAKEDIPPVVMPLPPNGTIK